MGNEETQKKPKNNNQRRWLWNNAIVLGEKQTHRDRMTRSNNEDLKSKNEWNGINEMNFRVVHVKYYNKT